MTDVMARIGEVVSGDCLAAACRKKGCRLSLDGAPEPYLLVDMDHKHAPPPGAGQPKCDYIFFGWEKGLWVAPLELKRGRPNFGEIVRQLRSGADVAHRLVPVDVTVRFRPVAVHAGSVRTTELRRFRQEANRIRFRGQRELVRLVRCGKTLREALNSHPRPRG